MIIPLEDNMSTVKFFICPMSKNIVDAVISLNDTRIGLLPSRRQIDYNGGYVGWNTQQFYEYVNKRVIIARDHGGQQQGNLIDDGRDSYSIDAYYMDIIHVDPWKSVSSVKEGLTKTISDIHFICEHNSNCKFEVGTEEAIFPISTEELRWFLENLKNGLPTDIFERIEYVVIQSGVRLDVTTETNVGNFSKEKLKAQIAICNDFGKKAKEHNGDFLSREQRSVRFELGLSTINIGPEISIFENKLYLNQFYDYQLQVANSITYNSGQWKKWVSQNNFHDYFRICGHYVYNQIELPKIDVQSALKSKILSFLEN